MDGVGGKVCTVTRMRMHGIGYVCARARASVLTAHTYICEGLLSHNKSPRIDKDEDKEFDPGPFVQDDDGTGKSATADGYFDLDRFSDLLQKLEGSKKRQQRQRSVEGRRDIFAGGLAKMMSNF